MRELVFALEFRGRAGPVEGSPHLRRARTTAPSQALSAVLTRDGVESRVEPLPGETAVLDSRVERFPDGSFVEDGTITYGSAGAITFVTMGRGHVGPSPVGGARGGDLGGDGRGRTLHGRARPRHVVLRRWARRWRD